MLLLLAAITYMDRVCISQMAGPIRADLGLDVRGMGLVFSAFSVAYALFEVPSGWLIDRYGPRWMLARIVFWWSLLTAATGLAGGLASLMMIRFLFGIGEAGAFPGVARVYDRWLPGMAHGRGFGIVLMAGTWSGHRWRRGRWSSPLSSCGCKCFAVRRGPGRTRCDRWRCPWCGRCRSRR